MDRESRRQKAVAARARWERRQKAVAARARWERRQKAVLARAVWRQQYDRKWRDLYRKSYAAQTAREPRMQRAAVVSQWRRSIAERNRRGFE